MLAMITRKTTLLTTKVTSVRWQIHQYYLRQLLQASINLSLAQHQHIHLSKLAVRPIQHILFLLYHHRNHMVHTPAAFHVEDLQFSFLIVRQLFPPHQFMAFSYTAIHFSYSSLVNGWISPNAYNNTRK